MVPAQRRGSGEWAGVGVALNSRIFDCICLYDISCSLVCTTYYLVGTIILSSYKPRATYLLCMHVVCCINLDL